MRLLVSALVLFASLHLPRAQASEELPADIATGLLPLTTYAITYFKEDDEGARQWLRSTGASLIVINSLRLAFKDTDFAERPNGSPYGFPSGHIAFAMPSAAFLGERYGWRYGLPAYAVVGYIAENRVDTDHHKWRDVITSGVLAYGLNLLFVTPQDAGTLAPIVGPEWLGLRWERSF
jgi:membrane-associated phospholipid phosphatase